MDFYLDMEIDEDNVAENLADDLRKDFTIECNITQLRGQANTEGDVIPTVYYKNNVISNVRMEYSSNNEEIITIDEDGHYKMINNGETTISVRILGNEISTIEIPVTVEDVTTIEYNIIVSPIITSIRQGLSNIITAKIIDNLNHEITDTITLTASGT